MSLMVQSKRLREGRGGQSAVVIAGGRWLRALAVVAAAVAAAVAA